MKHGGKKMQAVILRHGTEVFNPSSGASFDVKEGTFLVAWEVETNTADLAYIMACPVPFTSFEMAEQILQGINVFLDVVEGEDKPLVEEGDDHAGN